MQPPPHVVAGAATVPKKGSRLLLPLPPDVERARAEAKASHDRVLPADMTLLEAATKLGVDAPLLLRLNQARPELKGLQLSSELLCGTRLRTRPACLLLTTHYSLLTTHYYSPLTTHHSLLGWPRSRRSRRGTTRRPPSGARAHARALSASTPCSSA